jgi:hypothetical protein
MFTKNDIVGGTYTLTVPNHIENTDVKTFSNSKLFNINTDTFLTNVLKTYTLNSDTIINNGITSITETSPTVTINKIISTGVHNGDFYGYFEGNHKGGSGNGGKSYALSNADYNPSPKNPPAPNVNKTITKIPAVITAQIGFGKIISSIKNLLNNFLNFELSFFEKYF